MGLTGTTPSTASVLLPASELGVPGTGNPMTAVLPTRSAIALPSGNTRDDASFISSGVMRSPVATMYLNESVDVVLPETYGSTTSRVPAFKVNVGVPVTTTASENDTLTVISRPAM